MGLSQSELVNKYNLYQPQYSNWETGVIIPNHKNIKDMLCEIFSITAEEFTQALEYSKHLKRTNIYEVHLSNLKNEMSNTTNQDISISKHDYEVLSKYFSVEELQLIKSKLHKLKQIQRILN